MFNPVRRFTISFVVLVSSLLCFEKLQAQDFEYGTLTTQDTSTNYQGGKLAGGGIILNEFGSLTWETNWPYTRKRLYHAKIKLLKADAFKYGDIEIPYYRWSNAKKENIEYFEAVIYTPLGNGKYKKITTNLSGSRHVNQDKNLSIYKYPFPNLTEGCIIEYRYELETPDNTYIPWVFQGGLPKLHSEYWVHMPVDLNCKVSLKGGLALSKNYIHKNNCSQHAARCRQYIYAIDSIPAIVPEHNMGNVKNYISALYFTPAPYFVQEQHNGVLIKPNSWASVDDILKEGEDFGIQLKKTAVFKKLFKDIVPNNADTLAKARAIYTYVNHHVKYKSPEKLADCDIEKAFTNGVGNIQEINLMLVTALRAYGINADPVLLSTKLHGEIDKDVAKTTAFNYIIAKTHIGNKDHFLDASDRLLPFGMVPDFCFNDTWRVIRQIDSCYWLNIKPAFKANTNHIIDLTLQNNGSITGTISTYYQGYAAYEKRKAIKGFNHVDEYFETLKQKYNGIKILSTNLKGTDTVDIPLIEIHEVEIPVGLNGTAGKNILFNPYVFDLIPKNPYESEHRVFPVDCGPPSEVRFTLTLHLPAQFEIPTPPQDVALKLPGNGGSFVSAFNYLNEAAVFSHIIQLNRSVYLPDEYPSLKELFNKIIRVQKADVIIKPKS